MKLSAGLILAAVLVAVKDVAVVIACSYVEVPYGSDGDFIVARSMELGGTVLEKLWMVKAYPQGWDYPFHPLPVMEQDAVTETESGQLRGGLASVDLINGKVVQAEEREARRFSAKHGFVANAGEARVMGLVLEELIIDGMNEHGLMVSGHTFQTARYARASDNKDGSKTEVQYLAFIPWVLSQYESVAELRADLSNLLVTSSDEIPTSLGIHWGVADRSGDSVVIESMDGVLKVHDNTVGVMTNDPPFDFHLHNLNQYAFISPANPLRKHDIGEIETEIGPVPHASSHGHNTVGLPGDSTPAGRFIRLYFYREIAQYSIPLNDEPEAIIRATHILNSVDIPKGVLARLSAADPGDYTQWVILKNPSTMKYMYRSYNNMQWHSIDMNRLSGFFHQGSNVHPKKLHMFTSDTGVLDVTENLL